VDFFGIGFFEIILIMAIALVVIGPDRVPEYARKFGKLVRNFRRMTSNLTGEMKKAMDIEEEAEEIKKSAAEMNAALDDEARAIGLSLETEASEIAKSIGIEVEGIEKTLTESTGELSDMLGKETMSMKRTAGEIKDVLDKEVSELARMLDEGTKKLSKVIGGGDSKVEQATTAQSLAPGKVTGEPVDKKAKEIPKPVTPQAPNTEPINIDYGDGS
jgi:sec-independent protein translocase protein TatB